MACFAIGTFPAMISLGFSTQKLQTLIQQQKFRNFFGIILIIYGLYLLTIASIQVLL
jgi:sulfite exporter TauE/SafE